MLDQWLLERQENLPLTIISVLSSDCDGLYVTPSNASHDSFEQILERFGFGLVWEKIFFFFLN